MARGRIFKCRTTGEEAELRRTSEDCLLIRCRPCEEAVGVIITAVELPGEFRHVLAEITKRLPINPLAYHGLTRTSSGFVDPREHFELY